MEYRFSKLHGAGNDFIFFDDLFQSISFNEAQTRWLCDRHFGIGADGIILVRPAQKPDCVAFMHYINADGSLAEMCGNGVRCFTKYLVDRGLVSRDQEVFYVETLAGPKMVSPVYDESSALTAVTVDMGRPQLDPGAIPTALAARSQTQEGAPFVGDMPLDSPWGPFRFTCVSMGNPHAVCLIDTIDELPNEVFLGSEKNLASLDIARLGPYFCTHEAFPEQTNVEFAVIENEALVMRVHERGVGETLACGTGACAAAFAAHITGRLGMETDVQVPGGTLHIRINGKKHLLMTGPVAEVYTGIIDVADFD